MVIYDLGTADLNIFYTKKNFVEINLMWNLKQTYILVKLTIFIATSKIQMRFANAFFILELGI